MAFLQQWLDSEYFYRSGLGADTMRRAILQQASSPGDVLRLLMEGICAEQYAERWADCTPDHALYVRQIKKDFPEALIIHIVRDGRDVALSLARQGFIGCYPWHRRTPEIAAASYWAWIVQRLRQEESFLGGDLLTVKYENLVRDQESVLKAVGEFLGKPMDPQRILENPIGSITEPNTSFAEYTGRQDRAPWETLYDEDLLRAVERIMGPMLQAHGYPVANRRASQGRKLVTAAQRLSYCARFRLGDLLRYLGQGSNSISPASMSRPESRNGDPTLRPGDNIARIREIVRL